MAKLVAICLLLIIRIYQTVLSPLLPARCRYYPTCSEYARLALLWHGPYRGLALAIRRVLRCHPFGGHGLDFVPLPLYRYTFVAVATPRSCTSHLASSHSPATLNLVTYSYTYTIPSLSTSGQSIDKCAIRRQALVSGHSSRHSASVRLPERGVFKDCSSYSVCLNHQLKPLSGISPSS